VDINIDCSIKSNEYYEINKDKFNSNYNLIYKRNYAPKSNIGDCSYLYKNFHPTSYDDFLKQYLNSKCDDFSFKTHKGNDKCGRSREQLKYLAECYYNDIKKKFPKANVTIQDCLDNLIVHIIIETYDGHEVERYFVNLIRGWSHHYIVEECDGKYDSELGIDFIIRRDDDANFVRYMQVKPNSFFYYTIKHKALIDDRKNAFLKELKLNEIDENGTIEYLIYDKDEYSKSKTVKIATREGKKAFRLSDIVDANGQPKFDIKKDFKYEIPGEQKENDENNQ
jgi:hypothetical protein